MKAIAAALAKAQAEMGLGCIATIDRFPDYVFAEDGRIVSFARGAPKALKPIRVGNYVGVQLRRADGSSERAYVHRVICEAFYGPGPDRYHCRHLNGDKADNSAWNLIWGTPAQNEDDKRRHGTATIGERNPMSILSERDVAEIRQVRAKTGASYARIAKQFGVSTMTAYRAAVGKSWSEAQ